MTERSSRRVAVLTVTFLALTAQAAFAQAGRDVAQVLPHNTTAYLRLSDIPRLYAAMDQSGLKSELKKLIRREEPALALDVEAWDNLIAKVRSLHISFHGAAVWDYDLVDLDVLVIAETSVRGNPRAWLPPMPKG